MMKLIGKHDIHGWNDITSMAMKQQTEEYYCVACLQSVTAKIFATKWDCVHLLTKIDQIFLQRNASS